MLKKIIVAFVVANLCWIAFLLVSGTGYRLFGRGWEFHTVAEFGEAFGGLSAFMASLAAAFTFQTLLNEREENRHLREREEKRDRLEIERDDARSRREDEERMRDLELTYFRMLELRRQILDDVTYDVNNKGVSAFKIFKLNFLNLNNVIQYMESYAALSQNFSDSLDHYFRFTYHVIKFADDNFEFEKAYVYVRLLRAQLSNGEQLMIAINALFGAGKEKMLPLINKYSLLHNIPLAEKGKLLQLDAGLEPRAFDSELVAPVA
jgi:hypothetical protein